MGSRKAEKKPPFAEDAKRSVEALRNGEVIVQSTDTVWGLACDATSPEAVERLSQVKGREQGKPLIILVADEGQYERYAPGLSDAAWDLIQHCDRPLTTICPSGRDVAGAVLGPDGTLAVRLVRDPYLAYIIRGLGKPLASTSANTPGTSAPQDFKDVPQSILDQANYVSTYRRDDPDSESRESMIVSFDKDGRFAIVRQ
jgi:L-threonylcarbamoyladenylate synthase